MKSFFEPRCIAVAGVSRDPDKLGSIIFANLLANRKSGVLKSRLYALNPVHRLVGGQHTYPSIPALPEVPELLIVAVPEPQTLGIVEAAAKAGVKAAIVVTSGYAETGRAEAERRMAQLSAQSGMRILGPNTIGVVDMVSGVDSLFLRPTKTLTDGTQVESLLKPLRGGIAVISQSGHLGQSIVEGLAARAVGVRVLVGTGNQTDVSVEDVMEYFADDADTNVIALYLEGVRDGRRFLKVARRASRSKPVVVFKAGKTAGGARAALTHTASLAGNYEVYRTAFRQGGLVEATSLQELVDFSVSLSMLPEPGGDRLVVVTNAGGIGTMAVDEAQKEGLRTDPLGTRLASHIRTEFGGSGFVSNAALGNPVDLTASVSTEEFVRVVEEVVSSKEYDLALVMPTHQAPAIDPGIARKLILAVRRHGKPACMCIVGKSDLASRIQLEFMGGGVPSFPTPERAVRALAAAVEYARMKEENPWLKVSPSKPKAGLETGPLPRGQVGRLLAAHGIREPRALVVRKETDLRSLKSLRFPAACKLLSPGLPHKADVGGVVLGVKSTGEARATLILLRSLAKRESIRFEGMLVQEMVEGALELILGCNRDQTFGPVVAVGLGGTYAELMPGVALGVAPVTPAWAKSMIRGSRLEALLSGYRGGPSVSMGRLCAVVSRFSRVLLEHPELQEIEVNPLMAKGSELLSVDARALVGTQGARSTVEGERAPDLL